MSASPKAIDTSSLSGSEPAVQMRKIDRVLEQASWFLMPMGFVVIILGWVGASSTPWTFEQIPYLISGGLLGLGMTVAGGMLYVGSWVARTAMLVPAESPTSSIVAALQNVVLNAGGSVPAAVAGAYVRTPSGTMFHDTSCSIVAGRADVVAVSQKQADKYKACGMCDPLAA